MTTEPANEEKTAAIDESREGAIERLRGVLVSLDLARGMMGVMDPPGSKLSLAIISVGPDGKAARLLCQIDQTEHFAVDLARVVGGEEGALVLKLHEAAKKESEG